MGLLNVIAEHKASKTISIAYDLNDKETDIQLFVQTYDDHGNVLSNMLETIGINAIPDEYALGQNYPNPFNPVTKIDYGLPIASHVRLSVFDLLGREVATLVDRMEEPGYRSVSWDGMDQHGKGLGAGMYFYVIQARDFRQVRKMVLLK